MLKTVKVPAPFEPLFQRAEEVVGGYFSEMTRTPEQGTIQIHGERYVLIRGESLFSTLRESMEQQFGEEVTEAFLYDLARTLGRGDALHFAAKMGLEDPVARLSAGPVHFSHTGWAFVDISPDSAPSPDDNFLLLYTHPNTFESEYFARRRTVAPHPVCVFSAGYSAGWCSYAFGLELDARELECEAAGGSACRFIMATRSSIDAKMEGRQHVRG
jgi:hypothetical protein